MTIWKKGKEKQIFSIKRNIAGHAKTDEKRWYTISFYDISIFWNRIPGMASKDTHNSFNMFIFAEKKHNICHIVYVKGKEKQNSIMKKVWYFSGQQKSFNNFYE